MKLHPGKRFAWDNNGPAVMIRQGIFLKCYNTFHCSTKKKLPKHINLVKNALDN